MQTKMKNQQRSKKNIEKSNPFEKASTEVKNSRL